MKDIILLGSTGSVGRNVLDIVSKFPERYRIKALVAGSNIPELCRQAEIFSPTVIACADMSLVKELKDNAPKGIHARGGIKAVEDIASAESADIVFMAISGMSSLLPLIAALKSSRTVALASKEPVVSAGKLIADILKKGSARIIPVDSEHSALFQCLEGRAVEDVRKVYITGSGGALLNEEAERFDNMPLARILDHPKWNMGPKITVDSATLMNKGLEVIEARWLFDIPPEKIKVIINPEAVVHSMVEFNDGTVVSSMFSPDMRFPILRALSYPDMPDNDLKRVDFVKMGKLTFLEPDIERFPALPMAYEAMQRGGTCPAVLNGSNNRAVNLFLEGKIKFTDIVRVSQKVLDLHDGVKDPAIEDILAAEKWAEEEVLRSCLQ